MPNACWVCGAPALPDKLACHTCFEEATREKETDAKELTNIIRESTLQVSAPEMDRPAPSTSAAASHITPKSDDSSDNEELEISTGFDFALLNTFAKLVKEAIGWDDSKEAPRKILKYLPNLKKEPETLPFIDELEDLIKDEWLVETKDLIARP